MTSRHRQRHDTSALAAVDEWTWPTPPPPPAAAAAAAAAVPASPSALVSPRAQVGALLHVLHREADAMEAQGVARWHPSHAAALAALTEARGQMHTLMPAAAAAATPLAAAHPSAALTDAVNGNAEIAAPLLAASMSPLFRLPCAPLLLGALLRLSVHPSAAVRLLIAAALRDWITGLLQAHSSLGSATPPFLVDVLAEVGQAAADRSHDFDAAVTAAWSALAALCGPAALLPVQQPAHTWTARMHAAWKAEEEAQRRALEEQAAAVAAAARHRDRQRLQSRNRKEASKRTSVSPTRSPKANQRRMRFLSSEAPVTPTLSAEPVPTPLSSDRRTSVGSVSSGGVESESSDADADADADADGDEEVEDDEEGDEGVLDEESGAEPDEGEGLSDDEASTFRLKDGNRRLQERDDSSDDDDEEEDEDDEDGSVAADAQIAGQEQEPQPDLSAFESQQQLQQESTAPAGAAGGPVSQSSQRSADHSSSSSPSQPDSDATRPLSDEEGLDDAAEGLDSDDHEEEEEEDEDAMHDADGVAIAAAPVVRAPPSLALTPAQELASTSPQHALVQLPLSSFSQHQFQQALHHLTQLVAAHPDQRPMDETWMSFVLLTTHAQGTDATEPFGATGTAAAAAVPPSTGGALPLTHLLASSRHLSSFALLTSCAKYLIKHHLRSNFGAALPTLAHLDRVLTSNIKGRPMDSETHLHTTPMSEQRAFVSRLPLQRVLLFMDAFEKFIHHSAAGCAALPASLVDGKARDFFAANLHSCTTFFARIRAKLVQASVVADAPAATVYHAQLQLQPLLNSLSHMWSDAPRSALAPSPYAQSLQHVDLLNHRQLLETVADLSQAYVRLGNPGAITSLSNLLRSKLLVLSTANPAGIVFSRSISFFSLCFFLPGALLQSVGRTEHAIEAYKRAIAEASAGWGPEAQHPASVHEPLLLANSIALQACIRGLAACHAHPDDSLPADMAWTESISARWEWLLHTLKQTCPTVLQPLLPAVHTVQEVCRWPLQVASHQSARLLDHLALRPEGVPVSFEDRAQLVSSTARLRHNIRATIGSMHSEESTAVAPYFSLNSEQQAALSDDLLLLATSQRLLHATGPVAAPALEDEEALAAGVDGVHLSAAYGLTSWEETAALSTALVQHRLPDLALLPPSSSSARPQSLAVLSTLASLELPDAARTLLHVQCAAAVAQADEVASAAVLRATPLSVTPLLSLMDTVSVSKLRRAQLALQNASPASAGSSSPLVATSLLLAQHALHGGNTRLASSLLQRLIATVPASTDLAQHAWILATIANVSNGYGGAAPMHQLLQIVGLDPFAIIKPVTGTLLPFAVTLASQPPSASAPSSPATRLAFSYLVELVRSPSLAPSLSLPAEYVAERAVTMLREGLQREGASPHLWQEHGHLFYMRALQLTCVPASHAHCFLRDAPPAPVDEEKPATSVPPGFAPLKSKRKGRLGAPPEAHHAQQVDGSEESNRGTGDEDYAQLRSLVQGVLGLEGPAAAGATMAALSAVVFAINAAIDAAADESSGGPVLVRSTSLTRPAPPMPLVPDSFPSVAAAWMPRLHSPLWSALCKALPHYRAGPQIEFVFVQVLLLACMRAARVVAYAESALFALVQAQQLLSCSPAAAAHAASHPARSRVELPLTLLTLLTRFGGELSAAALVGHVLSLPPRTFLGVFPQLFARTAHAHAVVRSLVQALVCSIGEHFPHQVVFPLCIALHEEEEWRRDEQRCAAIDAAEFAAAAGAGGFASASSPTAAASGGIVTPKHQMLLRMVHAIDRRTVSTILQQQQQQSTPGAVPLHLQLLDLFSPRSSSSPSDASFSAGGSMPPSTSPSTFLPLLSSVHRLVLELNRIAFLWEDSYLWEFRRLQSELEVHPGSGGTAGGFAGAGARGKMVLEELELIMQQFQYRAPAVATNINNNKLAAPLVQRERAPDPAMLQLLRARYSSILAPLLYQLLDLHRSTLTVPAATPHELHFQRKYSRAIGALLEALQQPSDEQLLRPASIWPGISVKVAELRRQMSRLTHLHIKDISPLLAKWQALSTPRPAAAHKARSSGHSRSARPEDAASAYPWWRSHAVPTTQSPQIFLAGMQGTEDLYENAHPNPAGEDGDGASGSDSGGGGSFGAGTYLQSFDVHIELLRTKTRPKKLSFFGSDGRSHTYLLKSREDLHLDARMMQVLQSANRVLYEAYRTCHGQDPSVACLLARAGAPEAHEEHVCHAQSTPLYARTFSVIPLSDKSGLLRWIDGVTAIFDLYKLDQTRRKDRDDRAKATAAAAAAAKHARSVQEGKPAPPPVAAPPVPVASKSTDLFAQKLLFHLQAAGLSKSTPRKDIPLALLVRVLEEMETDSRESVDALQRELWLSSACAGELHAKSLLFTRSLASMSMLGYTLGLGDRHLGNMMLSLARGDLLHIDWNISLDRGLKLPIPEVVPFRLTPLLARVCGSGATANAPGLAAGGPGGNFSRAATAVMHCMRQREHHFASLLSHALVYSPLSEWKPLPSKPFLQLRKNADMRLNVGLLQAWLEGVAHGSAGWAGGASVATAAAATNLRRLHELQRLCGIKGQGHGVESIDQCMLELQQLQPLLQQAADPTLHLAVVSNPAALASFHGALSSVLALQRSMAAAAPPTREEKNKHAFHAVKRIQQKLCGIETVWHPAPPAGVISPHSGLAGPLHAAPAPSSVPLSVSAQVELLIAEATNKENLARLYEGWAPWI